MATWNGRKLSLWAWIHLLVAALSAGAGTGCQRQATGAPEGTASSSHPSASHAGRPPLLPNEDRGGEAEVADGLVGVVLARRAVEVAADREGRVTTVHVQVGDAVHEGDPLASLDARLAREEVRAASAALDVARAEVAQREAELDEVDRRFGRRKEAAELFSKEELDALAREHETARAALDAARAEVAGAGSRLDGLRAELEQNVIRAPFDGTVSQRYLDPGAALLPGDPIVRLISSEDLLVRFAVPPEDARPLRLGTTVTIRAPEERQPLCAAVERVSPEVDPASESLFVEARLLPGDNLQAPAAGTTVRVFLSGCQGSDGAAARSQLLDGGFTAPG